MTDEQAIFRFFAAMNAHEGDVAMALVSSCARPVNSSRMSAISLSPVCFTLAESNWPAAARSESTPIRSAVKAN